MDNVASRLLTVPAYAQYFSIVMHVMVIYIGAILIRGHCIVFRAKPSNVGLAMIMLLSSMVTTSAILLANAFSWFRCICLFCRLNNEFWYVQIVWSMFYAAGFILLYLVLNRKIDL
jgi:hypothetical protein